MENHLDKMKKSMPYTVPEGFFDEMEERLMQEVATEKKKPTAFARRKNFSPARRLLYGLRRRAYRRSSTDSIFGALRKRRKNFSKGRLIRV